MAAVAYVDPGNVATNTAAGAAYGYLLLWVLVGATLMAGLVQYLSAKVGWLTGRSLPALVGERNRPWLRRAFWVQAEVVAIATDLAEIVGGSLALNLLFGLPVVVGAVITTAVSTALLLLQSRRRQKAFERVVTGMLAIVAVGFLAGLFLDPPDPVAAVGGLVPRLAGADSALLAVGMLGATVMPHAVYLHSALVGDRHGRATATTRGRAARGPARRDARDGVRRRREHRHAARGRQHPRGPARSTGSRTRCRASATGWARASPCCSRSGCWPRGSPRPRSAATPGR